MTIQTIEDIYSYLGQIIFKEKGAAIRFIRDMEIMMIKMKKKGKVGKMIKIKKKGKDGKMIKINKKGKDNVRERKVHKYRLFMIKLCEFFARCCGICF
jgi:hypothetical protein